MRHEKHVHTTPVVNSRVAAVVLFAFVMLYAGVCIDPAALFFHSGPFFMCTQEFAARFFSHPGGATDYAGVFLTQLNHDTWAGAVLLGLVLTLLFLLTDYVFKIGNGRSPFVPALALVPSFLLLALASHWEPALASACIGIMLALCGVWAMRKASSPALRIVCCYIGTAILFALAGLWPALLFIVLTAILEFSALKRPVSILGCFSAIIAVPLAYLCFPDASLQTLFTPWKSSFTFRVLLSVYLFIPVVPLVFLFKKKTEPGKSGLPGKKAPAIVAVALMFIAGGIGAWQSMDHVSHATAQMDYYLDQKDYAKVLAIARNVKSLNFESEVRLHLALFHADRLGDDFFTYTNQAHWDLYAGMQKGLEGCRAQMQTLMELGQVNEAEHLAGEAFEWEGDRPDVLKTLAEINVLKKHPQAARIFLNNLRQIPFHRAWADACLKSLDTNIQMPYDTDLTLYASNMVTTELAYNRMPTELFVRQPLITNPQNRMAFEFLMTDYLLTGDLAKFAEKIDSLDKFGFKAIPRHYEEALLLYERVVKKPFELKHFQIRPETRQRFERFAEAVREGSNMPEGNPALVREFSDTYWYYFYLKPSQKTSATMDDPTP